MNPDQFVEDEDDDTFSYSIRISAQDLLLVSNEYKHVPKLMLALSASIFNHNDYKLYIAYNPKHRFSQVWVIKI